MKNTPSERKTFKYMWRRTKIVFFLLISVLVSWELVHYFMPSPQRHIVIASGSRTGLLHNYVKRYAAILARSGIEVVERETTGSQENLKLIADPKSGVDVAFTQAGVAKPSDASQVLMIASLFYSPMWIFYTLNETVDHAHQFCKRRIAVAAKGSGSGVLPMTIFEMNRLQSCGTQIFLLDGSELIAALKTHKVDFIVYVAPANNPLVWAALNDPSLKLVTYARADAYTRLLPYVSKLTLPQGVIDVPRNRPEKDVTLIATKELLVARKGLHPAIIDLLYDAAHEIHGVQGFFERAGEFPSTVQVDSLPVSKDADRHKRFGSSLLYQYFPVWLASALERAIIVLFPVLFIIVPLFNIVPQILRWRMRSRIYKWYGELVFLEKDVTTRQGELPTKKWLADLDRLELLVAKIRTPYAFAGEAYTLREHIDFVRNEVKARAVDTINHSF